MDEETQQAQQQGAVCNTVATDKNICQSVSVPD